MYNTVFTTQDKASLALRPLTPLTDDLDDALLHGGGVEAAVGGAGHDLVQEEVDQVLV